MAPNNLNVSHEFIYGHRPIDHVYMACIARTISVLIRLKTDKFFNDSAAAAPPNPRLKAYSRGNQAIDKFIALQKYIAVVITDVKTKPTPHDQHSKTHITRAVFLQT